MAQLYMLVVRRIPWAIGHTDLYNYFAKFGKVHKAHVVFDKDTGISKNYGYVVYDNIDTVTEVLRGKHVFINQAVHVSKHEDRKSFLTRKRN